MNKIPYKDAFRPGAPYKGEEILRDLKTIMISEFKPAIVFLSHSADYNMDHRALYLFTTMALWDLAQAIQPVFYPCLVHYKH